MMLSEYWATLSIYDHRRPAYRRSLVLFDRVVIPVPIEIPEGSDLSSAEIDRLSADVDYLQGHNAAMRYDYEQSTFEKWRAQYVGEVVAARFNRDKVHDTRVMLAAWVKQDPADANVVAVPVYDSSLRYESQTESLMEYQQALTMEIARRIPVPREDVPLELIVRLRDEPAFKKSLERLRVWQQETLPDVLVESEEISSKLARKKREDALREFDRWIEMYRRALHDAKMEKVETAVTTVFAVGGALAAGSEHFISLASEGIAGLFNLRKITRRSWKAVEDQVCAPAGVVIEAERAMTGE